MCGYVRSTRNRHFWIILLQKLLALTVSSAMSLSLLQIPPMKDPMLTPATVSMGMPASKIALIMPTWEQPRAPPPPSTSPTDVPVTMRASREKSEWMSGGCERILACICSTLSCVFLKYILEGHLMW